jgi:hypothetical protein
VTNTILLTERDYKLITEQQFNAFPSGLSESRAISIDEDGVVREYDKKHWINFFGCLCDVARWG